jgi:hypothetical protein
VSVEVNNLQRAETLVDELAEQEGPLSGFERIETISQLTQAGYSSEEIAGPEGSVSLSLSPTDPRGTAA